MDGVVTILQVAGVLVDHDGGLADRLPSGGIGNVDIVWIEVTAFHFAILDRMTITFTVDPRAIMIVVRIVHRIPSTVVEFKMGKGHVP